MVSTAPALHLYFVNDTPAVSGDRVYAEIGVNKPGAQIECHLTRLDNSRKNCKLATYTVI